MERYSKEKAKDIENFINSLTDLQRTMLEDELAFNFKQALLVERIENIKIEINAAPFKQNVKDAALNVVELFGTMDIVPEWVKTTPESLVLKIIFGDRHFLWKVERDAQIAYFEIQ